MAKNKAQNAQVPEYVTTVRNFCQLLSGTGAHMIMASYDGSGDSGDMDISVQVKRESLDSSNGQINTASANTGSIYDWRPLRCFVDPIIAQKNSLITTQMLEEFIDAMYDFLPGGWEINDGSFGEINVEVANGRVSVEHNERIVDINTSSAVYE